MKILKILSLLTTIFMMQNLLAQGFYLGAGLGNSFYDAEFSDINNEIKHLDKSATGFKFIGGFQSESFFNIEGSYRSLGKIKYVESGNTFESKTTGWDVYGLGRLEILKLIDLMGKAGVIFWNTESMFNNESRGGSGTSFAWGIGAGVHLGSIGVRLEWEHFEVDIPKNLSMLCLSATYGF
ncbi:MAG: outer membrane beta-barrel protein [Calditrichaceae bacterium]|nr:outer membrane beta-barrel protein [Calditrichaceae bacterium]MBN2709691.1 outer membrane beta-barrel protein [Calditrichaceae bacterium]RQV94474.1 MAG: hypothetical protein EH224_10300 [Calditrichota bacterium]